jgi:hypothetical protein
MAMINGLGSRVEVAVKLRRKEAGHAVPRKAFRSPTEFRATLPKARKSSAQRTRPRILNISILGK